MKLSRKCKNKNGESHPLTADVNVKNDNASHVLKKRKLSPNRGNSSKAVSGASNGAKVGAAPVNKLPHTFNLRSNAVPCTSNGDSNGTENGTNKVPAKITSDQAVELGAVLVSRLPHTSTRRQLTLKIPKSQPKPAVVVKNQPRLISDVPKIQPKRKLSSNRLDGIVKDSACDTSVARLTHEHNISSRSIAASNSNSTSIEATSFSSSSFASDTSMTIAQLLQLRQIHTFTPTNEIDPDGQSLVADFASIENAENVTDVNDGSDDKSCADEQSNSEEEDSTENDDADDSTEEEIIPPQPIQWILESTFETKEALDALLKIESCWSCRSTGNTSDGKKVLYRCNKVKRISKDQCAAAIFVIVKTVNASNVHRVAGNDADDDDVVGGDETCKTLYLLHRKNRAHTHDNLANKVVRVSETVKQLIIEQYLNGRRAKKISYSLLDDPQIPAEDIPSYKQVVKVVNAFKKTRYGDMPISMRQLCGFVEQHNNYPDDLDEPFIVSFEKSPRNVQFEKYFRFFISTRRLLSMAATATIVHSDATHQVTTEKLPLIVVGVSDCNKKFHLSGITLANHERTDDYALTFNSLKLGVRLATGANIQPRVLVCDADPAIHNGFKIAFGDVTREIAGTADVDGNNELDGENMTYSHQHLIIMCYFHVLLNIGKNYKFVTKSNKRLFKDDVKKLHLCGTEQQFVNGCSLFVKKWKHVEPEATRVLNKSFFKSNKNWYIGCAPRVPKTNNPMETFNGTMKRCQTENQRQPLKQFVHTALAIVRQRSKEYLRDKAPYQMEFHIPTEIIARGRQITREVVHEEKPNGDINFYIYRSGIERIITLDDVHTFHSAHYETFDEFVATGFDIWTITFPKQSVEWNKAFCSCPAFDADYICKHIIHVARTIGLLSALPNFEEDYDNDPLFHTSRGRPKHPSKALHLE